MKKANPIAKILKIIFLAIAILVLTLSGIIMFKANKYPNKVPDVFGYKPMMVLSGSMETEIYTGDLVFVKEVDPNTLKVNDIIAFRNEADTVTTHRIIEIVEQNGEKLFRTKGDNNSGEDANLVKMEDVEGIYTSKISKVGNFLIFLQQPVGLISVLFIILIVGTFWLYIANKLDAKKETEEDKKYKKEFEEFKKMQKEKEQK